MKLGKNPYRNFIFSIGRKAGYINKNVYLIPLSIFLGLIITLTVCFCLNAYSKNVQTDISQKVLRFHVLANSDSEEDQKLKAEVKDEIINYLSKELAESNSKEETKAVLLSKLDDIEKKASDIIHSKGYSYAVKAEISHSYFPTKQYGDITLPCGEYEALRILIGNGEGQNWWCVMFPPLCFVDGAVKEVPAEDKQKLKNILPDDEYNLISAKNNADITIKFKLVELFNSHYK